jgi:hypothetical protein
VSGSDPAVRVRGIYTTALTELLREPATVVQASPPIRERFDADFPLAPAAATVETTADRQGVTVSGRRGAVERVRDRLLGVSRDTLAWDDAAPEAAVFDGLVTDTLGSGAVVDLGDAEGFLPFDAADGYVESGDRVRVQVRRPEAPWSDRRAELATNTAVPGELCRLVRGSGSAAAGAARLEDLLPVDVPDGWAVRWGRDEDEASMDALGDALAAAAREAALFDAATDADPDELPGRVAAPRATVHVWFGREGRFALDGARRRVESTMPGHHRVKAATDAASAGVDLAEALVEFDDGDDGGAFPFDVVTRQFGPHEGDRVAIGHGKPDGRLVTLGRGTVTGVGDGALTLEREMSPGGSYDALGVERRAGDVATTKFTEGRWWYATVYRGAEGERRGTYANVCTPVELFPDAVRYVDLHVDVVKGPDGVVERVDDDELDAAVAAGQVSEALAERARAVATKLEQAL